MEFTASVGKCRGKVPYKYMHTGQPTFQDPEFDTVQYSVLEKATSFHSWTCRELKRSSSSLPCTVALVEFTKVLYKLKLAGSQGPYHE